MTLVSTLKLWAGRRSAQVADYPQPVDVLDLLGGDLTLIQTDGVANWSPGIPSIKNGGVWTDPPTVDGRVLVFGRESNVTETVVCTMTVPAGQPRYAVLSRLASFRRQAMAFWDDPAQWGPVFLEFQAAGSVGPQYAVVYNLEVDVEQDVLYNPDYPTVTLTIEREPSWRIQVPPGQSAKRWSMFTLGINPNDSGWDVDPNDPTDAISGTTTLRAFDERGTSNVNYIDVDADDIPGDQPADVILSFFNGTSTVNRIHVFRETRLNDRSLPGAVMGVAGESINIPSRCTLNGGDAALNGSWAKLVDATNGVLSNGSIATRYVARHNTALVASDQYIRWLVYTADYPGKYAVFVRGSIASGVVTTATLAVAVVETAGGGTIMRTTPRQLKQTGYGMTYLGVIDLTGNNGYDRDVDGEIYDAAPLYISLMLNKATATSVDIRIQDLVLIPIDQPNGAMDMDPIPGVGQTYLLDFTGVLSDRLDTWTGIYPGKPLPYRGQPISLIPGVTNRLYFVIEATTASPTADYLVSANIVPRTLVPRGDV